MEHVTAMPNASERKQHETLFLCAIIKLSGSTLSLSYDHRVAHASAPPLKTRFPVTLMQFMCERCGVAFDVTTVPFVAFNTFIFALLSCAKQKSS